jgi:signal transduction histidine kinase
MTPPAITGDAATTGKPRGERERTDESLAGERAKTDAALAERLAIEERADAVLDRAREEADEVLTEARDEADYKLEHAGARGRDTLAEERAREDEALAGMRARADEILRSERAANARLLIKLLPLERNQTDQHLLTERARSDAALANRDDFLGMVSHDLRDLLSGILVSSAMIEQQSGGSESGTSTRVAVERIQRSAGRMNRLIGDLVDVVGIDAGRLSVVPAPASADDVIREAIDTWQPHAQARGIVLEARGECGATATFDRERILQVLGNLVTNAIKFSPKGGLVTVGGEVRSSEICFSVKDAGAGIPPGDREAIFERFWQVGKNDRRGLGLGLYISRCLVEAHGGRIRVECAAGGGSDFSFTIPVENAGS